MNNTRRELINLKLRSLKRLNPAIEISALRIEEGKKYGMDETLMPSDPLKDVEKEVNKPAEVNDESSDSESEEEEDSGFSLGSATALFGVVSASAAALTYLATK